jgi:serine/threonine protein kinase
VVLAKYGPTEYYAMKVLKKEDIIEKNWMQRFRRETRIMNSIKHAHPFILNLIGVTQTQVSIRPELLYLFNISLVLGPTQPPIQWIPGALSWG